MENGPIALYDKVEYDIRIRVRADSRKLQSSVQVLVEAKRVLDKGNNFVVVSTDIDRVRKDPEPPAVQQQEIPL